MSQYRTIGLAKESESPENPGGLERRVALIPKDVAKLVAAGYVVSVEKGAGEGIGFGDEAYQKAGAQIESADKIYANKDMVIKFKGPATERINDMQPHSTLFCMAHVQSIPERLAKCVEREINLIAMEEIVESPQRISDQTIISYMAMETALSERVNQEDLQIIFVGYSSRLVGAITCAGRSDASSIRIIQSNTKTSLLPELTANSLVFIDGSQTISDLLRKRIKKTGAQLFDLAKFEANHPPDIKQAYQKRHPLKQFGKRRIECLHHTGQAGARYGLELLRSISPLRKVPSKVNVAILGYGNVGQGSIEECYVSGVACIHILGQKLTKKHRIAPFLEAVDLVINAADPAAHGGTVPPYLVTTAHTKNTLTKGAVVIDLIGGSKTNRSPVENVVECTYLTDPYFIEDGVYFAAQWGWPMIGMMKESSVRYSSQILSVLLEKEQLLKNGLAHLAPGLQPAIMTKIFG